MISGERGCRVGIYLYSANHLTGNSQEQEGSFFIDPRFHDGDVCLYREFLEEVGFVEKMKPLSAAEIAQKSAKLKEELGIGFAGKEDEDEEVHVDSGVCAKCKQPYKQCADSDPHLRLLLQRMSLKAGKSTSPSHVKIAKDQDELTLAKKTVQFVTSLCETEPPYLLRLSRFDVAKELEEARSHSDEELKKGVQKLIEMVESCVGIVDRGGKG